MKRKAKILDFRNDKTIYPSITPNKVAILNIEDVNINEYSKGKLGDLTLLTFNDVKSIDALIVVLTDLKDRLLKMEKEDNYTEFAKNIIIFDNKVVEYFTEEKLATMLDVLEKHSLLKPVIEINSTHGPEEVINFLKDLWKDLNKKGLCEDDEIIEEDDEDKINKIINEYCRIKGLIDVSPKYLSDKDKDLFMKVLHKPMINSVEDAQKVIKYLNKDN